MTELSQRSRRLFELARHQDDPEPVARDRVERSLGRRIALGAGIATGSAALTQPAAGLGLVVAAKALGIGAMVGAVAGGAWWMTSHPSPAEPPRTETVLSAPAVAAAATEQPSATLQQELPQKPAPVARASIARGSVRPTTPAEKPEVDQLRLETEGLRAIQQAVRAGSPARALVLIDEQNARYRGGLLGEERAAARVLALCQSGQAAQARAEAAQFERRWPKSALVARVRSSCTSP